MRLAEFRRSTLVAAITVIFDTSNRDGLPLVALAGTRAAWLETAGGNNLEQTW